VNAGIAADLSCAFNDLAYHAVASCFQTEQPQSL